MKKIRIGAGAGFAGDRIEPAIEIIENGNIDYIVFECLAERTIVIGQQNKLLNPDKGYDELLEYRMEKVLGLCIKKKIKIITNMGSANPAAAVGVIKRIAEKLGIHGLKIAGILGDEIAQNIHRYMKAEIIETKDLLESIKDHIVSANVYLGTEGILEALRNGADVIITGRVADPSLFLAPLMYEFGWNKNDYQLLGTGTLVGHLMECAGQVTGGYFADPGCKEVPELWNLGFPIAEVCENGQIVITKTENSGGKVTEETCKEQLLYEIHDPAKYYTPDVIADFSQVLITEIAVNKVLVTGGKGIKETGLLKTVIGYRNGYIGEAEISYGGSGAFERAKLAGEIIKMRLEYIDVSVEELRIDFIGVNSLNEDTRRLSNDMSYRNFKDVRLRVCAKTLTQEDALKIGREVEALYTNGPAGGGGVRKYFREIISIASILVPCRDVKIKTIYEVG